MSDGERFAGQQYDPRFDMTYPFVQTMRSLKDTAGIKEPEAGTFGQDATDLSPKDHDATMERAYDKTAINASRADYFRSYPKRVAVDLPIEITSLLSVVNKTEGTGEDLHPISQQGSDFIVYTENGRGNVQANPRATSSGSASVQISVGPVIKRFPKVVPAMVYEFFMNGNFTEADILARLVAGGVTGVLAMPVFVEKSETLILAGQQVSLSARADTDAQAGGGIEDSAPAFAYYSFQYGKGKTEEFGSNSTILQLPPSIHGALTITPNTDSATASVQAQANTNALLIGGATMVAAITNDTGVLTATATATVTPDSLSATSVASVPTTGKRLYDYSIDNNVGYGDTFVSAVVLDMTVFA